MGELFRQFARHAEALVLEQVASLLVLLDAEGRLLEANGALARLTRARPRPWCLEDLLVSSSAGRLRAGLVQAREEGGPVHLTLHASGEDTGLPASYDCWLLPVADGRFLCYADPLPLLDDRAAEEAFRVTVELANTTRELQRSRHELAAKTRALEEALARIEALARTDSLTGLPNRRHVMERLEEEVVRARRYRSPLSVLLLDFDHFKRVNDRFGHQAGDRVLERGAGLLARELRQTDCLGRYGGEEFLGVLPETGLERAAPLAARLGARVRASAAVIGPDPERPVTVSIGVSAFLGEADTSEDLLARADSALYRAKAEGRDRVCTA
jgi:diguanylate cyclase (GGDEF)-like protein